MSRLIEMVLIGNKHTMKDDNGTRQRYHKGDHVMLNAEQVLAFSNKFKLVEVLEAEKEISDMVSEIKEDAKKEVKENPPVKSKAKVAVPVKAPVKPEDKN